ncbi:MAG TPA: hypothetical protein VFP91_08370 [Vicinamibacterales bacterium]|nr:hypothetical protein [Vicinamibacterales bacterium]
MRQLFVLGEILDERQDQRQIFLGRFDFDRFKRHRADVLDLMFFAAVEPRPSALLAEVPGHRPVTRCSRP